jgi:hypothetical protein
VAGNEIRLAEGLPAGGLTFPGNWLTILFASEYIYLQIYSLANNWIKEGSKGRGETVFEDSLENLNEQITKTIQLKPQLSKHLLSLPVYLDFLQMTELIRKTGGGYRLVDPFLEFWLKSCLRVQESSALSAKEKLSAFRSATQDLLKTMRSQLGKEIEENHFRKKQKELRKG